MSQHPSTARLVFGLLVVGLAFSQLGIAADDRHHELTNTAGKKIEARVLGFSRNEETRADSVKGTLTANHFVHLTLKTGEKIFRVQVKRFSDPSQRLLQKINNTNAKSKFWNRPAVQAAKTLLDDHTRLLENGEELAKIEKAFNLKYKALEKKTKSEPVVRFVVALIKTKLEKKASSAFELVIRSQPDYWPAWRALIYAKLGEVNAVSAAARLKAFHRAVLDNLREIPEGEKIEAATIESLVWVKEAANVLATNPAAKKVVADFQNNPETTIFLKRYEEQIARENAKVKEELRRRSEEERERIDALIVKANQEYEDVGAAIQRQYAKYKTEYDTKFPEYQRLASEAQVAGNRASVAQSEHRTAQQREVFARNRVDNQRLRISNLRSQRDNEEDPDRKRDLDEEIRGEERVLRNEERQLQLTRRATLQARNIAVRAIAVYQKAVQITRAYYNSVLAPLIAQMKDLERQFVAFATRFRAEYAEAIANNPKLKNIFDRWDALVAQIRKQLLGVGRYNRIKGKATRDAAKEKIKQEALELLSLLKFSVDDELRMLSRELAAQSQQSGG